MSLYLLCYIFTWVLDVKLPVLVVKFSETLSKGLTPQTYFHSKGCITAYRSMNPSKENKGIKFASTKCFSLCCKNWKCEPTACSPALSIQKEDHVAAKQHDLSYLLCSVPVDQSGQSAGCMYILAHGCLLLLLKLRLLVMMLLPVFCSTGRVQREAGKDTEINHHFSVGPTSGPYHMAATCILSLDAQTHREAMRIYMCVFVCLSIQGSSLVGRTHGREKVNEQNVKQLSPKPGWIVLSSKHTHTYLLYSI